VAAQGARGSKGAMGLAAPAQKLCISAASIGLNVGSASAEGICSKKITLAAPVSVRCSSIT
jgi:hypothetical protein